MVGNIAAILAALPFVVVPLITIRRLANSTSLDSESEELPVDPPLVSIVIPARNEARHIESCLRSVLTTTYPNVEVIVVNDNSTDATGDIARSVATEDPRVRVVDNAPLPDGWFGKQWACENGALASRGDIILFADADTRHRHDLVTRSVNAMLRRGADLFTVFGRQDFVTFWEKLVQPQIFVMMAIRFGGTETVNESKLPSSKIANGQCLFVTRQAYEEMGRHWRVRAYVAEDLMLAQGWFAAGRVVVAEGGLDQLSTRMYASLRELVEGWGKNVFVAGRYALPPGLLRRLLYPVLFLSSHLVGFLPGLVLVTSVLLELPKPLVLWAAVAQAFLVIWWLFAYRAIQQSPLYAFLNPLGAAMAFLIFLRAMVRGRRVEWKGREYFAS